MEGEGKEEFQGLGNRQLNWLLRSIKVMMDSGCDEVTLEAEVTNKGALALYGRLGFIRAKRLFRYYLNGVDAFRLKLLFPRPQPNYYNDYTSV
ncbi:hypothetical protein RD792_010055 [Penstemon davidsonii]|uniref:N-acetyltransferase domain-containing protein n=1 Tax=Penstemon davidsonii TaxID=160366 RepID=A0ABR0D103_9LAMI|nr:hypothetical protein RD792_010055 [Penstemon davidsonii]